VKFDIYDVVINTVPAQLVNKHVIARFKEGVFLLELASEPGGFDKEAVKRSGIRFLRASGVPAKVAPVSAGKILLEEIAGRLGIKY
jgi:dipicolinate synthase subunit A